MNYVLGYLAVGLLILIGCAVQFWRSGELSLAKVADVLRTADLRDRSWREDFCEEIATPVLVSLLLILIWPAMIVMVIKEYISDRRTERTIEREEFHVLSDHLGKAISIDEIEAAEVVSDPLGGVPPCPFGHLNSAWANFKASLLEGDQLWSFSAPWAGPWGEREIREGYVVVRGNAVGPWLMTRRDFGEREEG